MAKSANTMRDHAARVLDHQTAKAAAGPAAPRVVEPAAGPTGRRLAGNLGPGTLYPGVGKLVQRTGQPHRCGTMTGYAFGYTEHPNTKDPKRLSTRFAGQFLLVDQQGTVLQGVECYLPSTLERGIKAALRLRGEGGEPVPFAVELWCEPDAEGRPPSPLGYSYVTYDRAPQGASNPLMALAYEAGIFERPAAALPAPSEASDGEVDPETGEPVAASQAAA